MDVATHTVATVCHPKHSNNWDFSLRLARHSCHCGTCRRTKLANLGCWLIWFKKKTGETTWVKFNVIFNHQSQKPNQFLRYDLKETIMIFYLNNSQDLSAERPNCQMMCPMKGHAASSSAGWGPLRRVRLAKQWRDSEWEQTLCGNTANFA